MVEMCGFTQGEGMCVMGMRNAELRTTELRRADMHVRTCGHVDTRKQLTNPGSIIKLEEYE